MHIDFDAIRRTPIESVIRSYGWECRRQGNSIVVKHCPLPTHTSKELWTFKAGIVENLWRCWSQSCRKGRNEGGDVIDLICEVDGIGALEAAKKLAGINPRENPDFKAAPVSAIETSTNKPLGFTLQTNPKHEMIQSRGISVDTAASFGVGYYRSKQGTASMDDRIVFPLWGDIILDDGDSGSTIVGYIGRTVLPITPDNPKWKMGKGLIKSMLFGLERCNPAKLLVLVESCWGVLWLSERGIQAASLLGSELTEGQEKALAPFRMVNLALDNDDAGREATTKIAERLKSTHAVKRSYFRE